MTLQELQDMIYYHPAVIGIKDIEEASKREMAKQYLRVSINESVGRYSFPFAIKETTFSGGTVANQSDYELSGENQDALRVLSIIYGSDELFLPLIPQTEAKRYISQFGRPGDVCAFAEIAPNVNLPKVRLIDTPATSGQTISYVYSRRDMPAEAWPDHFCHVIVMGAVKRFDPRYSSEYESDMAHMISVYANTASQYGFVNIDPQAILVNNEINRASPGQSSYLADGTPI